MELAIGKNKKREGGEGVIEGGGGTFIYISFKYSC